MWIVSYKLLQGTCMHDIAASTTNDIRVTWHLQSNTEVDAKGMNQQRNATAWGEIPQRNSSTLSKKTTQNTPTAKNWPKYLYLANRELPKCCLYKCLFHLMASNDRHFLTIFITTANIFLSPLQAIITLVMKMHTHARTCTHIRMAFSSKRSEEYWEKDGTLLEIKTIGGAWQECKSYEKWTTVMTTLTTTTTTVTEIAANMRNRINIPN